MKEYWAIETIRREASWWRIIDKEAADIAVSAIEKQIPQKPSWEDEPYPKHMNGAKAPFCPVCGQDLLDEDNDCFHFCPDCGQAIDWSDD